MRSIVSNPLVIVGLQKVRFLRATLMWRNMSLRDNTTCWRLLHQLASLSIDLVLLQIITSPRVYTPTQQTPMHHDDTRLPSLQRLPSDCQVNFMQTFEMLQKIEVCIGDLDAGETELWFL